MGSICATAPKGSEERVGVSTEVKKDADFVSDYKAELQRQHDDCDLPTEPSFAHSDSDQLKALLQRDLREGWELIRTLERVVQTPPRLLEDENLQNLDFEQTDDVLHKRRAYAKELVQRVLADSEAIKNLTTSYWVKLSTHYQRLKKSEDLTESFPNRSWEIVESLQTLLDKYEALIDEYVRIAAAANGSSSAHEVENMQLDLRAAETRKEHCRDVLVQLEEANRALLGSSVTAKGTLSSCAAESESARKAVAESESEREELEKRVAELEDDLSVKRELLVSMKDDLAAVTRKNQQLQAEVDRLKRLQSKDQMAAEMSKLEEEKRELALRLTDMESELATKQDLIASNKRKLAQLEDALKDSEDRIPNAADIDVRMHNMHSTLRELFNSIDDIPEEDLEDD